MTPDLTPQAPVPMTTVRDSPIDEIVDSDAC